MEKLTKEERKELKKQEFSQQLKREARQRRIRLAGIWMGIFGVLILSVVGLMKIANSTSSSSVLSSTINIPEVSEKDVTIGNKQAKAVLIEYSDFQCPACASYHPFVKQLLTDFDGKILFVYRFFPLAKHKNAIISSQVAYAAYLQGKFIEMQNMLFENQKEWAESDNALDLFIFYASRLNLDIEKLKKDINSDDTKKVINDQLNSAISLGINSTPTFFLNNKQIPNPRSYEEFKGLIEKELKWTDL